MLKIKYVLLDEKCKPEMHGEWIDLKSQQDIQFSMPKVEVFVNKEGKEEQTVSFDTKLIPLGIILILPKGLEAQIVPRSSLHSKKGLIQTNSKGVIDNSYCGAEDILKLPALALRESTVKKGERLCQMKIVPSQNSSFWTKLKYMFTRINVKTLIQVDVPGDKNRGGFGQSGY